MNNKRITTTAYLAENAIAKVLVLFSVTWTPPAALPAQGRSFLFCSEHAQAFVFYLTVFEKEAVN